VSFSLITLIEKFEFHRKVFYISCKLYTVILLACVKLCLAYVYTYAYCLSYVYEVLNKDDDDADNDDIIILLLLLLLMHGHAACKYS